MPNFANVTQVIDVPIPAGASGLSAAINIGGTVPVAIVIAGTWAAANLTFSGSSTQDGTFYNLYDSSGNELTVTAAASRHIILTPANFASLNWLKIRSGTSGTPVNQTGAPTLQLVVRAV